MAGAESPYPDEYAGLKELVSHVPQKPVTISGPSSTTGPSTGPAARALATIRRLYRDRDPSRRPPGLDLDGLDGLESNTRHNLDYVRSLLIP